MARRSSKRARIDAMSQFTQRKYKKKNSPQGRNDAKDWTHYVMKKLNGEERNDA
jgi:hypothetical protein